MSLYGIISSLGSLWRSGSRNVDVQEYKGENVINFLPKDVLCLIFTRVMNDNNKDLGACARVCKAWNTLISNRLDIHWKDVALRNALGKKVWEESIAGEVGDEPPFTIEDMPIRWKDLYLMRKSRSLFSQRSIEECEVDYLVPKTINGQPTTFNLIARVITTAGKPIRISDSDRTMMNLFINKYGDIPIEKSYWVRHTMTFVDGTRSQSDPQAREALIQKKGLGFYRLPKIIEKMIFVFLRFQTGNKGDGEATQCLETLAGWDGEFSLCVTYGPLLYPEGPYELFLSATYRGDVAEAVRQF